MPTWVGLGGPEPLGSMAPEPVGSGKVPQERDAEWVPGRAGWVGCPRVASEYQVLSRVLSRVPSLWGMDGLTSPGLPFFLSQERPGQTDHGPLGPLAIEPVPAPQH